MSRLQILIGLCTLGNIYSTPAKFDLCWSLIFSNKWNTKIVMNLQ